MQNFYHLNAQIVVTFYTQQGAYPLVARETSGVVASGSHDDFNTGLISVDTQNDSSSDLPSATVTVTDDYDWSTLLTPNDYVKIDVNYTSDIFSDEAGKTISTCLYCGLVSDINKSMDSTNNYRIFIITCEGIAKVPNNINLGTFSEITSTNSAYVLIPDDEKTGIRFDDRTSANIIKQTFDRFVLNTDGTYTDYNYFDLNLNSLKISDILKLNIQENADEAYENSSYNQYSNWNGTILAMVKQMAAKPFNEIFWTHENGVATFNYRPTPFDPDNWNALDRITVDTSAIISEQLDVTDQDQYSIFKLEANSGFATQTYNSNWSGYLAPLTNEKLITKYGYRIMEVETDYFNGNSQESQSVQNSTGAKNTNLSSNVAQYTSLVKTICSEEGCSDLYPYLLAIAQVEQGSSSDPINAANHGGSNITSASSSFKYGADYLKSLQSKAKSAGISDNLVAVQSYNFGSGFINYLKSQGSSSLNITDSENYSKKIARNNGNSDLTKIAYNTSVSNKYGKNYLYRNGANFFYAYEVNQYLGSGVTNSSSNTSNNSNESNNGTTESSARLHYPPYDSLEDFFAKAEGKSTSSTLTIPSNYGEDSAYNDTLSLLKDNLSRSTFISKLKSEHSFVTGSEASQLYTRYNNSNASSSKRSLSRANYLNIVAPYYSPTASDVSDSSQYLKSYKAIKANPKKAAEELMSESQYHLGSKQAYEIVEKWLSNGGKISSAEYSAILSKYPYADTEDGVNPYNSSSSSGDINSVPYMFQKYTQKLFNWYADNSKYRSGTIVINGTSGIEIGKRLLTYDTKDNVYWEYYIESVSHSWSFESGWVTTVGVTRGLQLATPDDQRRFTNPYSFYGLYQEFAGGYFGEPNLTAALAASSGSDDSGSSGTSSGGSDSFSGGSSDAHKAVKKALAWSNKKTSYNQAYHGKDPDSFSGTIYGDCSQLVYYAYKDATGINISNNGGFTTWQILQSPNVEIVGAQNESKNSRYKKIKIGDLIFFNTDGNNGHVGLATSDGCVAFNVSKGIETFSIKNNSYWWGSLGTIARVKS